jgi:diaminopimelate decarboxylase
MREMVLDLRAQGIELKHLDIGGGLGVPYRADNEWPPHPDEYARVVKDALSDLGLKIVMEPGRMIIGNAGILVTRVIYVKEGQGRRFTIVDAAMNDLVRPTLYDAHHDVWPIAEASNGQDLYAQDLVGPVCETGDYLALDRPLPAFKPDDLVAIMTAGAYGAVMASSYNTRPLVPEVMVDGARFAVVRPRPTYDDLIGQDRLPPWFSSEK